MSEQLSAKDERATLQINYEELLANMIAAIQQARTHSTDVHQNAL